MPVPTLITDLSTTAASNSPGGGESPTDGDNYLRALSAFVAQIYSGAVNITLGDASGDTITVNAGIVACPNGLNVDSNTLVIDATNNRVGVGVAAPGVRLDIDGVARISGTNSSGSYNNGENLVVIKNSNVNGLGGIHFDINTQPGAAVVADGAGSNGTADLLLASGVAGALATVIRCKSTGQARFEPLAADPTGAQAGDVYYNSVTNKLRCHNGTSWNDLF